MKNLIIILTTLLLSGCFKDTGFTYSNYGTISFKTDSFFNIKTDIGETFKIEDTSIEKWQPFLFITNSKDTSKLLRGIFTVYDSNRWTNRYNSGYYIYLTDGIKNLRFETDDRWQQSINYPIGTKVYVFYQKSTCTNPKTIK